MSLSDDHQTIMGSAAMHSSAVLPWLRRNGVNTNEKFP